MLTNLIFHIFKDVAAIAVAVAAQAAVADAVSRLVADHVSTIVVEPAAVDVAVRFLVNSQDPVNFMLKITFKLKFSNRTYL